MPDKANIGGVNLANISDSHIQTGDITTTITAGGDVVGRDKIINHITQIKERALTAAEEADKAQAIARQRLAEAVTAYVERLGQIAADDQDALPGGPYRGLHAYTLYEAEIFFGRDKAMEALLAHLQRGRLTILHAESGAGKSSLLQAGIQYQLIVQGHVPLYVRPYDKPPELAIKQALLPGLDNLPELAQASLRDYLHQVAAVLGPQTILVILLDQFEEVFFTLNEPARQAFVDRLADCLDDESLNVRWVLALRTEFFGSLANFRPRIRNPFENDYRLNRLTLAGARTVIIEPAARQGITFEPELVEALLADLRDPDSGEVAPAQLQLVCLALYNLLRARQEQGPDVPAVVTLAMYQAEGRAEGILRGHLNRVLRRAFRAQDRELARQLLIALVSSEHRRIRRTQSELSAILATYLTAAHSLDGVLAQLVDSRLLNVDEDEVSGEHSYELAHDYLVNELEIDPELQAQKAAQEMMSQELQHWRRNPASRIPPDRLASIELHQNSLALNDEAKILLHLSRRARQLSQLKQIGAGVAIVMIPILAVLGVFYLFRLGPFAPAQIIWLPIDEFRESSVSDLAWNGDGTMYVSFDHQAQIARLDQPDGEWVILSAPGEAIYEIDVEPASTGTVYILNDQGVGYHSQDGGKTWDEIVIPLPPGGQMTSLAILPDGTIYIGTGTGQIFVSKNRGSSWDTLGKGPETWVNFIKWLDDRLIVGTEAGLWAWTVAEEWAQELSENTGTILTAEAAGGKLFASGAKGIYRVGDQEKPFYQEVVTTIAVISAAPPVIIAGTLDGDLLWWGVAEGEVELLASGTDLHGANAISVVKVNPQDPDQIWIGTDNNLLLGNIGEWLDDRSK